MTATIEPTTCIEPNIAASSTAHDIVETLTKRLKELPDKGLAQIQQYLTLAGQEKLARRIVGVNAIDVREPGLKVSLENFEYPKDCVKTEVTPPRVLDTTTIENDSDAEIRNVFSYAWTEERTFEYSFTEGLKVGTEASVNIGVPELGASGKISTEVQFTAEQRWTYRNSVEQEDQQEVTVPPHTSVFVEAILTDGTLTAHFKGDAIATAATVRAAVRGRTPDVFKPFGFMVVELPLTAVLKDEIARTVKVKGSMKGVHTVDIYVRARPLGDATGTPD